MIPSMEAAMAVKPIPEGYHTLTPFLMVEGASSLIEFLKSAFEAQETERIAHPDGSIMHAQLRIGDSVVMLSDVMCDWKPTPTSIYLYVNDADATYQRALQAGATSVMEPADQFYGDRQGSVKDPVGNYWWIATHIEDVPREEIAKRAEAFMRQHSQGEVHSSVSG
jgi:PhnB protein